MAALLALILTRDPPRAVHRAGRRGRAQSVQRPTV